MDDSRRTFIITGLIVVIVLAIIFIGIFYLIRAFQNRTPSQNTSNGIFPKASASVNPLPTGNPNGSRAATNNSTDTSARTENAESSPVPVPLDPNSKIYATETFQITYPKSWGILTCGNSQNFELDPTRGEDSKNVACNYAVKPVTIIVGQTDPADCDGETVKIGNYEVIKSKVGTTPEVDYRWCVKSDPVLDITHRVSSQGSRATSKQDFSKQIEDIIAKFNLGSRGS